MEWMSLLLGLLAGAMTGAYFMAHRDKSRGNASMEELRRAWQAERAETGRINAERERHAQDLNKELQQLNGQLGHEQQR